MNEPRRRTLPPPAKPKRKGHEPAPAGTAGGDGVVATRMTADAAPPPLVITEPEDSASIRTTVYSDARIEAFLRDVGVQALLGRLDVTKAAVWRWAMTELMERFSPAEVVEHFRTASHEQARVGRPRR